MVGRSALNDFDNGSGVNPVRSSPGYGDRKKGRLNEQTSGLSLGRKRPKEGSDSKRRYRIATVCYRTAQNARTFPPSLMKGEDSSILPLVLQGLSEGRP